MRRQERIKDDKRGRAKSVWAARSWKILQTKKQFCRFFDSIQKISQFQQVLQSLTMGFDEGTRNANFQIALSSKLSIYKHLSCVSKLLVQILWHEILRPAAPSPKLGPSLYRYQEAKEHQQATALQQTCWGAQLSGTRNAYWQKCTEQQDPSMHMMIVYHMIHMAILGMSVVSHIHDASAGSSMLFHSRFTVKWTACNISSSWVKAGPKQVCTYIPIKQEWINTPMTPIWHTFALHIKCIPHVRSAVSNQNIDRHAISLNEWENNTVYKQHTTYVYIYIYSLKLKILYIYTYSIRMYKNWIRCRSCTVYKHFTIKRTQTHGSYSRICLHAKNIQLYQWQWAIIETPLLVFTSRWRFRCPIHKLTKAVWSDAIHGEV